MGRFVKGDVVVVPLPFSDLSSSKRRPALVLADLPGDDVLLCQITARNGKSPLSISLTKADVDAAQLGRQSYVRFGRVFTADEKIVAYRLGALSKPTITNVTQAPVSLLTA